jgi:hypothetical protein
MFFVKVHFLVLLTKNVSYTGEKKQFGHATFTSVIVTLASGSGHKLQRPEIALSQNLSFPLRSQHFYDSRAVQKIKLTS